MDRKNERMETLGPETYIWSQRIIKDGRVDRKLEKGSIRSQ